MAASRIKGITIELNGDTTKLQKALSDVDGKLRTTQGNLKDLNKLLKLDPGNTELLTQKQRNLASAIYDTKERLKTLKEASKQLRDEYGEPIDRDQYDKLQREIVDTEQKLKNLKKEQSDFGNVAKQKIQAVSDKLQAAAEKLDVIAGKMRDAGTSLTTKVTTPILAVGTAVVKTTADFDEEMSKVKAISGAAGEDFDALRAKAREMGAETKFSATEAGEAFEYMAMAGWKASDMLDGIEGIMYLAAAAGEDLGTTSDIVTDALTAMGYAAKDSTHFADVLAAASVNANTNVAMMGETFKYAAPVAGTLGYSIEDLALATGLMANAGIKASTAGTTLRSLFTNMADPTDKMYAAMQTLNVSLDDGEGNMLSLRQVMDDLREGFGTLKIPLDELAGRLTELDEAFDNGELDEKEYAQKQRELMESAYGAEDAMKAEAAAALAGKRGMSGLLAIVNTAPEDYEALMAAIDNCDGAAQDMAETMQDNMNGQLTILKSQLQELAISFGDLIVPVLRDGISLVQGVVDKLNALDDSQKKTIIKVAAVAASVGPALLVGSKVVSTVSGILKVGALLTKGIGIVTGVLGGPLTIALAAVVAGGILVYKNWDRIKEAAEKLGTKLSEAWGKIKDGFHEFGEEVKTEASETWNTIKDSAAESWNNLKSKTSDTWNAIKKDTSETWSAIKSKVEENGGGIKGVVKTLTDAYVDTWKTKFELIDTLTGGKLSDAADKVKNKLGDIKATFTDEMEKAKEGVKNAIEKIKGFFDFDWSLPKLKMPHFTIKGDFSLSPPSAPKIDVDWYKKAYTNPVLFTKPTVLSTSAGLKGFGDGAGGEIVMGLNKLRDLIGARGRENNNNVVINVYASEGQSAKDIAREVKRELVDEMLSLEAVNA